MNKFSKLCVLLSALFMICCMSACAHLDVTIENRAGQTVELAAKNIAKTAKRTGDSQGRKKSQVANKVRHYEKELELLKKPGKIFYQGKHFAK